MASALNIHSGGKSGVPQPQTMPLLHGLNIQKRKTQDTKPATAFRADDADDDISPKLPIRKNPISSLHGSDSAPLDIVDPSIYEYDAVYDSMKSGERLGHLSKELDKKERKPKYMQNLLQMAEVRKRDRIRAEDVKIQRERELEGDDFLDKEKFVTSAYKAQQAEIRRLDEEEQLREEQLRRGGNGLTTFNTNILQNQMKKHDEAVKASMNAKLDTSKTLTTDEAPFQSEAQRAKDSEARLGQAVVLNDDNQIVDKRQLLSAGLNIPSKSADHLSKAGVQSSRLANDFNVKELSSEQRVEQKRRQARMIQDQFNEDKKRARDEEERKLGEIRIKSLKKSTSDTISAARERYLARKKVETSEAGLD